MAVPPPRAGTDIKPEVNSLDNCSKLLTGFLFKVISVIQLGFINDSSCTMIMLGFTVELVLSIAEFA